jgi:two-component system sensor histidine kinase RpfC
MPGMGGAEALQALRLMTRGRERLPVIMLSADVTLEAKREALEAGADAFLPKPIEALKLLDEIQLLAAPKAAEGAAPEAQAIPAATTRPTQAGSAEVINLETLGHLEELGSSAAFIEKLVGVFIADNAALLERIEQAVAGRNYQELRALLHAMKGSSVSMGTDRLTSACSDLGRLSDSELRLKAAGLVRTLSAEFSSARGRLESYLREKRQSAG